VDPDTEVELSFERDADLLMEGETAVESSFIEGGRQVGVVDSA
jgi:hypothetical protein